MRRTNNCIGENINRYCYENDLTLTRFTDRLCRTVSDGALSDRAVQKWASGESYPSVKWMIALSRLLGVSIDELLKEEIDDFGKRHLPKAERLSEEGRALLEKLCAGRVPEGGKAEVYYRLFKGSEGTMSASKTPLCGYGAVEADYKTALSDAARRERTDDFLRDMNALSEKGKTLSPDELIREYLRYTDIALCEEFYEEDDSDRFAAVGEESFYRYGKYDGESGKSLRAFSGEKAVEVPHPSPAENNYYYRCFECDAENAEMFLLPDAKSAVEADKNLAQIKKTEGQVCDEAEKWLEELLEKGVIRRIKEEENFVFFADCFLDGPGGWEMDGIAEAGYCRVSFEILLSDEEIVDFLCERCRKNLCKEGK